MEEQAKVLEILAKVQVPGATGDLIKMRMVRELEIRDSHISFKIVLPDINYAHKAELYEDAVQALQFEFPNKEVHLHFITSKVTADNPNLVLPQIKEFIAVGSGKGGVGKSTVAVNLAIALHQKGLKVGIMDADLYGPSIPTMLGLQSRKPKVQMIEGKHYLTPLDSYGLAALSIGNIVDADQAVVLRGPRLAAIIKQFINDCVWPELDYLIIDLPPGTGDIQLTLVQNIPLTGAVMVTTPQEIAVIDAVKAANMFRMEQIGVPILGVVENMSWFEPLDNLGKKYYLFGKGGAEKLAYLTGSKVLGQLPMYEAIREGGDLGKPVAAQLDHPSSKDFAALADQVIEQVAWRNANLAKTKIVKIEAQ